MTPILSKIKQLENKYKTVPYSEEDVKKSTELNNQLDSILYKHYLCLMDCESRNRSMKRDDSHEKPQPINDELKREFDELEEVNLNDKGGNKRQSRRRRLPRRRRSLRNRTHRQPRQTRRNQRRNTRRRNGRHHRTRSDRK